MKRLNKFLLLFAIFALTGSMASVSAQSKDYEEILGEYVGQLHVVATTFGLDETYDDVKMELKQPTPNNYTLEVAEMTVGGITIPGYVMNDVGINKVGNKYNLTSAPLHIVIEEIETPLGTFYNVPVDITLENGYVENNVMTLNIKAVATITIIIPVPVTINIGFVGMLPLPPDCDPVTNAKAQIENCEAATITWIPVADAKEYEISRDGALLGTVNHPTSTFTEVAAFEDGKSYTWTIKTICNQNEAPEVSVSATADCINPCNPATDLKVEIGGGCYTATITWTAAPDMPDAKYNVYRNGEKIATVTETQCIDSGFYGGNVEYTWEVKTVCEDEEATGISEVVMCEIGSVNELSNSVSIYPNPTEGVLHVETRLLRQAQQPIASLQNGTLSAVEVFDVMGKPVQSLMFNVQSSSPDPDPEFNSGLNFKPETLNFETVINISHLPSGIYFVRITTEAGTVTQKIVKH